MYQQYMNQIQSQIAYLSSDELKELLNNDDEVEKRVDEAIRSLESEKETMMGINRSLAEENVLQEPKIIELKANISELAEQGKSLVAQVQEKINEYKSKSNNISQDTALALLQSAAVEAEDESEKIFQQFLDREIDNVELFLEQFTAARKKMHERKLKSDKMIELIRNQANQTRNQGPSRPRPPQPTPQFRPPQPPYPSWNSPSMPMPGMPGFQPSQTPWPEN